MSTKATILEKFRSRFAPGDRRRRDFSEPRWHEATLRRDFPLATKSVIPAGEVVLVQKMVDGQTSMLHESLSRPINIGRYPQEYVSGDGHA